MAVFDIVVGTVFGTALGVAQLLEEKLRKLGHQTKLFEESERSDLRDGAVLLVVTSTTGNGDIPDNLALLFSQIKDQGFPYSPMSCALVGLGDSSYETFCGAGHQWHDLLVEYQCNMLAPFLILDASSDENSEQVAEHWLLSWAQSGF